MKHQTKRGQEPFATLTPSSPAGTPRRGKRLLTPFLAPFLVLALAGCEAGDLSPYLPPEGSYDRIEPLDLAADATTRPTTRDNVLPNEGAPLVELTLGEARAIALEQNLDLKVARYGPRIAAANLAAEQAAFEAVFTTDAGYNVTDSPTVNQAVIDPTDPEGEPSIIQVLGGQNEAYSVNPAIVKPLRRGGQLRIEAPFNKIETDQGRVLNPQYEQDVRASINLPLGRGYGSDVNEQQIRVAATQLGQALVRQKLEVIQTLAAVDRGYWRLYAARQAVDVRQQQVDLALRQLERARRLARGGEVAQVEVVRAESGLADANELLVQARANVGTQERLLKQLLNAPQDQPLSVGNAGVVLTGTDPLPVRYVLNPARLLSAAYARRGELLEAQLLIAQERASVLASRLEYSRPRVDLRYEYGVNGLGGNYGDALDVLGDVDFEDHNVGLQIEVPLGNRARRERLRAAQFRRLERLADAESRRLLVRREVFDAVADIETGWQRIAAAQVRVDAAQRLLEAEQRQFDLGTRTTTEVLEAQTNLAQAKLARIQALTDYETSRTDLAVATGTILGKSGVTLELQE